MQIWIYFQPGAGGDGFANLLEQCTQITKFDNSTEIWRLHRFVDNQPKFFSPVIDLNHYFRRRPIDRFTLKNNQLVQSYVDCVLQNKNIVCTSHHLEFQFSKMHDCLEILTKDLIKVLVTCNDYKSAWMRYAVKNLYTGHIDSIFCKEIKIDLSHFDHVLEIEKIHSDWNYVKNFCQKVGLEMSKYSYQDYQEILAGSTKFDPKVEQYQSKIDNGLISYTRLN